MGGDLEKEKKNHFDIFGFLVLLYQIDGFFFFYIKAIDNAISTNLIGESMLNGGNICYNFDF